MWVGTGWWWQISDEVRRLTAGACSEYISLQYALLSSCFACVASAVAFLAAARFVHRDRIIAQRQSAPGKFSFYSTHPERRTPSPPKKIQFCPKLLPNSLNKLGLRIYSKYYCFSVCVLLMCYCNFTFPLSDCHYIFLQHAIYLCFISYYFSKSFFRSAQ